MNTFFLLVFLASCGYVIWLFGSEKKSKATVNTRQQPAKTNEDQWEGSFWEAPVALSTRKSVKLHYQDATGSRTQRDVAIRSFEPDNPKGLIIGNCALRNATRTFRYDRMQRCTDLETGEIIPDLRAHLNDLHAASPAGLAGRLIDAHRDLLHVMFYVAKADGSVRAAEIEVIAQLCQEASGNTAIDADVVKQARGAIDEMNVRGFKAACKRIQTASELQYEQCFESAKKIVATQKTVHPNETAALAVMESLFKPPAKQQPSGDTPAHPRAS